MRSTLSATRRAFISSSIMAVGSMGGATSGLWVKRLLGEQDNPEDVATEVEALEVLAMLRSLDRRLPMLPDSILSGITNFAHNLVHMHTCFSHKPLYIS